MLKACKYCGRLHKHNERCDKAPVYISYKKNSELSRFRNTQAWQKKATEIKKRDLYICRACLANLKGTRLIINTELLEVHHIIPLKDAYELRLENDNLITLCRAHHELAESGKIGIKILRGLILLPPVLPKNFQSDS